MKSLYRRVMLFLGIVWRESPAGGLMSVSMAWKVSGIIHGSGGRAMNLDEAMEIATSTAITLSKLEMAEVSEVIAAEVERLREENEWMGIAGQQMARHLAEAKAELAAAKAASVVPVEVLEIREVFFPNQKPMWSVDVRLEFLEHRTCFADWLRQQIEAGGRQVPPKGKPVVDSSDRIKERGEG